MKKKLLKTLLAGLLSVSVLGTCCIGAAAAEPKSAEAKTEAKAEAKAETKAEAKVEEEAVDAKEAEHAEELALADASRGDYEEELDALYYGNRFDVLLKNNTNFLYKSTNYKIPEQSYSSYIAEDMSYYSMPKIGYEYLYTKDAAAEIAVAEDGTRTVNEVINVDEAEYELYEADGCMLYLGDYEQITDYYSTGNVIYLKTMIPASVASLCLDFEPKQGENIYYTYMFNSNTKALFFVGGELGKTEADTETIDEDHVIYSVAVPHGAMDLLKRMKDTTDTRKVTVVKNYGTPEIRRIVQEVKKGDLARIPLAEDEALYVDAECTELYLGTTDYTSDRTIYIGKKPAE